MRADLLTALRAVVAPDTSTTPRLVVIAALFTLFDAAATWSWLQLGIPEGNPIVRTVVDRHGPTAGMFIRAVWGVALVLVLSRLADRSRFAWAALIGVTLAMVIVGMVHVAGGAAVILAVL